jgi:alpha-mannosidase
MPNSLRKVIVVFKTHFDLGFTDLPDRVMQLYTGKMFNAVREVIDATASEPEGLRYSWTLPAWPLRFLLHDPSVPQETRQAARKLVEEGRLNWHAWPFTTHTAFCGLEDLVRGLHISRSLSEEFGRWPTGAKQTDVPGHTWILPSMLVRAGVKFLHLGCNSGSHAPHVPRLFWWEGPDGSRLLTYYSAGGYGTPLLPPGEWPYDTWLAVQQTNDNTGPQSPEELKRIRRTVEQGAPGVELIFGELGDFADSLLEHREQLAGLPVVPFDLADTWIHGIGTMPREVKRVRELRPKLLELEAIASLLDWPNEENGDSDDFELSRKIAFDIDTAYEQLLLFGEHTWGLDVKSTIQRVFGEGFEAARETEPYKRLESSWQAKASYVTKAEEAYQRAFEIVRTHWHNHFERLGRDRAGGPLWQAIKAERALLEAKASAEPSEEESAPSDTIPGPAMPASNTLDLDWLYIEVDPAAGGIKSLVDKRTGYEWVSSDVAEPFAGYRYDLYSAADIAGHLRAYGLFFQDWFVHDFGKPGYPEDLPHVTSYARDFKVSLEKGISVNWGPGDSLLLTGGALRAVGPGGEHIPPQEIFMRITAGKELRYFNTDKRISSWLDVIYLDYTIHGKKATALAESTVVPFPLNLPKAAFRLGQIGSVIDPSRDIVEGANRNLWCVDGWVDASDDRKGIAMFPLDMPLVSIGDPGIYRFEPTRTPLTPTIYAHLSNTQWGTNFPQWLEGDFSFRIKLALHPGDWRTAGLWQHVPMVDLDELHVRGEEGVGSFFRWVTDDQGFILLSLHPNQDGKGFIARYWDALGTSRRIPMKFPPNISRIWRCDLMERPIEELPLTDRPPRTDGPDDNLQRKWAWLSVTPHAIETLLIEFDKQ